MALPLAGAIGAALVWAAGRLRCGSRRRWVRAGDVHRLNLVLDGLVADMQATTPGLRPM